jgi:hypothetical protein
MALSSHSRKGCKQAFSFRLTRTTLERLRATAENDFPAQTSGRPRSALTREDAELFRSAFE